MSDPRFEIVKPKIQRVVNATGSTYLSLFSPEASAEWNEALGELMAACYKLGQEAGK